MMKNKVKNNPAPEGYSTVCPYLMVERVETQVAFLQNVFDAVLREEMIKQPDGAMMHAEVLIGDTVIMIGRAGSVYPARQSENYVYVSDPDEVYGRALKHGATSVMEPGDREYGNRSGGFTDLHGNEWWVACPLAK